MVRVLLNVMITHLPLDTPELLLSIEFAVELAHAGCAHACCDDGFFEFCFAG